MQRFSNDMARHLCSVRHAQPAFASGNYDAVSFHLTAVGRHCLSCRVASSNLLQLQMPPAPQAGAQPLTNSRTNALVLLPLSLAHVSVISSKCSATQTHLSSAAFHIFLAWWA